MTSRLRPLRRPDDRQETRAVSQSTLAQEGNAQALRRRSPAVPVFTRRGHVPTWCTVSFLPCTDRKPGMANERTAPLHLQAEARHRVCPNPFHHMCTLATCKASIRLTKDIGDWVAGFTSAFLNGDPVGEERLIYLMQVTEKLGLDACSTEPHGSAAKVPRLGAACCVDRAGQYLPSRRWEDGADGQSASRCL